MGGGGGCVLPLMAGWFCIDSCIQQDCYTEGKPVARRIVGLDLSKPFKKVVRESGEPTLASPTVDSLLRLRKAKATKSKRVVIRHKREF